MREVIRTSSTKEGMWTAGTSPEADIITEVSPSFLPCCLPAPAGVFPRITSKGLSIQVWGKLRNDYYLRYCLNQHLNFPDTVAAIRTVSQLYPRARTVLS